MENKPQIDLSNVKKDFGFTHISEEDLVRENLTVKQLYAQLDTIRRIVSEGVLPMLEELNKDSKSHYIKWDASRRSATLTILISELRDAL